MACAALLCAANAANARDVVIKLSIEEALATPDAKSMLKPSIKFMFGPNEAPAAKSLGSFTSSKKANSFGKDDKGACQRAFLSTLLSFQDRAIREGGDAVVKLTSFYRRNALASETEFECGTGAVMVGVAYQGEVIKLR